MRRGIFFDDFWHVCWTFWWRYPFKKYMSFTNLFFMVIVMIFERIIENRQIAPENGCIYDRPKKSWKWWWKWWKNEWSQIDRESGLWTGMSWSGVVSLYAKKCSTSPPGVNQVDGLPPAASDWCLLHSLGWKFWADVPGSALWRRVVSLVFEVGLGV